MDILIAGLRACLFVASFLCWFAFTPMTIDAAIYLWSRRPMPLACQLAVGIWVTALGSMAFSGHRLVEALFFTRTPASELTRWDAISLFIGLVLMTVGYFLHSVAKARATGSKSFIYYGGGTVLIAGLLFAILASVMGR